MKTIPARKPVRAKRAAAAPLDLAKQFQSEYVAPREPVLLDLAPGRYLLVAGQGAPGGAEFQARIGALYSIAFTVKMTRKFSGRRDYTIGKLEARYLNLGREPMPPREDWRWQLMIRTPEFVGAEELAQAVAVLRKRGKEGDSRLVGLETIAEGKCVQMLHVGPYDRESDTVALMEEFAASRGLTLTGPHHEIYISDPRRVAPEKLKTIIRLRTKPVGKG